MRFKVTTEEGDIEVFEQDAEYVTIVFVGKDGKGIFLGHVTRKEIQAIARAL